jgi:hypothetical protein
VRESASDGNGHSSSASVYAMRRNPAGSDGSKVRRLASEHDEQRDGCGGNSAAKIIQSRWHFEGRVKSGRTRARILSGRYPRAADVASLAPDVRDTFRRDIITAAHAHRLGTVPAGRQAEAFSR